MTERIMKEKKILFTMIPILSKSIKNKQFCERGEFYYYYYLQANKELTVFLPWTMDNDVQTRNMGYGWATDRRGPCVAHPQPFRQGPRLSCAHLLPGPRLPAWHGNIWTENIYFLTRHFPCGGQAWPTRGPPVAHPWPTRGSPVAQPDLVGIGEVHSVVWSWCCVGAV